MSDFTRLRVWEKAHNLALDVYQISGELPKSESYGLQTQMRRAAVSIPTNLAEGSGRSTNRDFARFVSNAIGSASELDYHLLLALDLGYIDQDSAELAKTKVAEIRRMLSALRRNLLDTKWVTGGV